MGAQRGGKNFFKREREETEFCFSFIWVGKKAPFFRKAMVLLNNFLKIPKLKKNQNPENYFLPVDIYAMAPASKKLSIDGNQIQS